MSDKTWDNHMHTRQTFPKHIHSATSAIQTVSYCMLPHCLDCTLCCVSWGLQTHGKHSQWGDSWLKMHSERTAGLTTHTHTQAEIPVILGWEAPAVILIWDRGEAGVDIWVWQSKLWILTKFEMPVSWPQHEILTDPWGPGEGSCLEGNPILKEITEKCCEIIYNPNH